MTPGFVFHRTASELRRRWRPALVLAAGFAVATLALGGYRLAVLTAQQTAEGLKRGAHVIAYLRDDIPAERLELLRGTLSTLPGVRQVTLVSAQEALQRLQTDMGEARGLFEGLEDGFLPRSIEISLWPVPAIADRAQRLAARLRTIDGVAEADVAVAHLERLASLSALGRWSALGLLGFALLAAAGAISVGIWAGRAGRRDEARVLAFLGMTRRSAALPAILTGVMAASLGGAAGLLLLFALWRGVLTGVLARFRDALGPLLGAGGFLPVREWLPALLAAALLGAAAGLLATRFRDGHAS